MWFEPTVSESEPVKLLLDVGAPPRPGREHTADPSPVPFDFAAHPASRLAAATLLRRTGLLPPPAVRPYFAICAVEAWHRVPVRQLADWSGIPLDALSRRLAAATLTPAAVAAWSLALHATWLLDVAELPATLVVCCMQLGRAAALGAVLGARGVRCSAGRVEAGAFAMTLDRYVAVLRAAFCA